MWQSVHAENGSLLLVEDPGHAGTTSVVAVIDTGVNPFHEVFRRPGLEAPGSLPVEAVDSVTGRAPLFVPIEPIADIADGEWLADVLEPRTLYRFAGTNLLFYSMMDTVDEPDYHGHGTGTAGTLTANAPEVIVVMVQTTGHPLDEAVAWAAAQPWIDVISISWGCPDDCFWLYVHNVAGLNPHPFAGDVAAATRQAWDNGKLVVNSAGNDGTTHWTDEDGAPWVIAVGGANATAKTSQFGARQSPDLISDYEVVVPTADSVSGYKWSRGTSFSAPTVAGAMADGVRLARQASGHTGGISDGLLVNAGGLALGNDDFRHAMNRSAVYWDYPGPQLEPEMDDPVVPAPLQPDGCESPCPEPEPPGGLPHFPRQPVNPVAPWLEMGWGYLNGTHAADIAAGLVNGTWPEEKPPEAQAYMESRQDIRSFMWPQPGPLVNPDDAEVLEPVWDACREDLQVLGLLPYGSPCPDPGH